MSFQIESKVIALLKHKASVQLGVNFHIPMENAVALRSIGPDLYRVLRYVEDERRLEIYFDGHSTEIPVLRNEVDTWLLENQPSYILVVERPLADAKPHRPVFRPRYPRHNTEWQERASYQIEEETLTEVVTIPVIKTKFLDGYISLNAHISGLNKNIEASVKNDFVYEAYDAVKEYFAKVISNAFDIQITIVHKAGEIISIAASSETIQKIDAETVHMVNEMIVETRLDKLSDHEIMTLDEIDLITEPQSEVKVSVADILFTEEKTKHYNHLRYLSSLQIPQLGTLQATGKPRSFIFFIQHEANDIIIWEPYDKDEATYIWIRLVEAFPESKKWQENVTELIRNLRQNNKQEYIQSKPKGFATIRHNYQLPKNGFHSWEDDLKNKLKKLLQESNGPHSH